MTRRAQGFPTSPFPLCWDVTIRKPFPNIRRRNTAATCKKNQDRDLCLPAGYPSSCRAHPIRGPAGTGRTGLGRLVHPCTPLTETSWVNWWCPPPAEKASAWPGAVRKATGKGCALYLPFDFFPHADSLNLHRQLFLGILEALLPAPSFRLETPYPETLSMSFYKKDGDYILHQVSHLAEKTNGDAPEIPGGRLKVSKKLLPSLSAARIYPSPLSLSCLDKGDWWELELPALSIHQIFRLSE